MTWSRLPTSLVLSLSLVAGACSPRFPQPTDARAIFARWIAVDPSGTCNPERLYIDNAASPFHFNTQSSLENWKVSNIDSAEIAEGALEIQGLGPEAEVRFLDSFDASLFSVLEVSVKRFGKGRLTVAWLSDHGSGELSIDTNTATGNDVQLFSFKVGRHPTWTGRISRLRLLPKSVSNNTIRILSVKRVTREVNLDEVAAVAATGVRVEFNADARPAIPALPGRKSTLSLEEIPQGARLRFATAVDSTARSSWSLSIEVEEPGKLPQTVWTEKLSPGGSSQKWAEYDLALDQFAGKDRLIHLVTSGPQPRGGLAWWADPRVEAPSEKRRVNVIVILLDTLRADRMSAYGAPISTTPFLKRWISSNGVLFENVVAPAPWTLPAHASLFSGLDAVRHGVNHHMQAPDSLHFLAEHLRKAGYTTAAVTGGGILRPHYGFAQGFDSFAYWGSQDSVDELEHGLRLASDFLKKSENLPFFLFLHTYEIHYPHRRRQPFFDQLVSEQRATFPQGKVKMLPPKIKNLVSEGNTFTFLATGEKQWSSPLNPDEKRTVRTMYDSAIAYTDAELAGFFETISRLKLRENTLIIVTSDHGEALGEDDRAGHSYLDDYNLMVPLMLEIPGHKGAGTRISRQVRLIDLMPTILDVTGIPVPPDLDGQSLLPLIESPESDFPNEAWAYAASSNRGLALRTDNRTKFTFNDAAWQRLWGQSTETVLQGNSGIAAGTASETPDPSRFRKTVTDMLDRDFAGTRIFMTNTSDGILRGDLTGVWDQRSRVKSPAADCRCIRWTRSGGRFELGPKESLSLFISNGKREDGGISGEYLSENGTMTPLLINLDHGIPTEPVEYILDGSSWRTGQFLPSTPDNQGVSIRIWSTGPPLGPENETPLGGEALSQLQALGYLH